MVTDATDAAEHQMVQGMRATRTDACSCVPSKAGAPTVTVVAIRPSEIPLYIGVIGSQFSVFGSQSPSLSSDKMDRERPRFSAIICTFLSENGGIWCDSARKRGPQCGLVFK